VVSLTLFCSQNNILRRGPSASGRSQTVHSSNGNADHERQVALERLRLS